jgi:hypothetical protein
MIFYHIGPPLAIDIERMAKMAYNQSMIRIDSSGVMTSYACSASCAHCLYCSAPTAGGGIMDAGTAENIARTLRRMGVLSMHIGGGEPFLNPDSLRLTIRALRENGIGIDYVETNAFWHRDDGHSEELIRALDVPIMVSIDPFHAEFVPLGRPLALIRLLSGMGWDFFVWQERYIKRLLPLARERRATRGELQTLLGEDYLFDAAREYGLSANGRALTILNKKLPARPAETYLGGAPCRVLDGRHCHVDLYGSFVPPGCPGIAIDIVDIWEDRVTPEKYPVATRLTEGGVGALYDYARESGFTPGAYISKCELCFFLREYLARVRPSRDVNPACFYESMRAAYAREMQGDV